MTSFHKSRKHIKSRRNTKRKTIRRHRGGDNTNSSIKQLFNSLKSQHKRYPNELQKGTYTIYLKELSENNLNKDKICHNYSLFSLLGEDNQVNANSEYVQTLLGGNIWQNNGNFKHIDALCNENTTCNSTKILPARKNFMFRETGRFKVRLYNLKGDANVNGLPAHSSRFEGGLWWHKFNGINALISIKNHPDFFQYNILREFDLIAYKVPSEMFKDNKEKIQIMELVIV